MLLAASVCLGFGQEIGLALHPGEHSFHHLCMHFSLVYNWVICWLLILTRHSCVWQLVMLLTVSVCLEFGRRIGLALCRGEHSFHHLFLHFSRIPLSYLLIIDSDPTFMCATACYAIGDHRLLLFECFPQPELASIFFIICVTFYCNFAQISLRYILIIVADPSLR
jgi:hypothetical protein